MASEVVDSREKELFYVSHVQWDWIKQRPQFIAEQLSKMYRTVFLYQHKYKKRGLKPNVNRELELQEIPRLPTFSNKAKPIISANLRMGRAFMANLVRKYNPATIWVTGPTMQSLLPEWYEGFLIYDCMDDHAAFAFGSKREEIVCAERRLMERADLVFASSNRLKTLLEHRYSDICNCNIHVVRNGFDATSEITFNKQIPVTDTLKLCYFGTIGTWFDFESIRLSLERFSDIEYKIIGPIESNVTPLIDSRIEYTGPVSHESLESHIGDCNCFIMPFLVNDIVLSVDPVKMYEYINYGKDIICVDYPEIRRFSIFADLYEDANGFCSAIARVKARRKRKYSEEDRLRLLQESTWDARGRDVIAALAELNIRQHFLSDVSI